MPAAEFPAELRLLLAWLRTAIDRGAAAPVAPDDFNWTAWLALVERHRVGALLWQRVPENFRAAWPAPVAVHLRQISATNTRRALARAAEQIALVRRLEAAGIATIAVKGPVLAQQLYGAPGARHAGDIDLLIDPADAPRADALMRADGWRRNTPRFDLTPLRLKKYQQLKPEFEYLRDPPSGRAELRWETEGLGDFAAMKTGAVTCAIGGQALPTLPPDLHTLYLAQHGARHGWFRLFWLVDLALALRAPAFDSAAAIATARSLGVERSLLQAAALAEELLGVARPAALAPAPAERSRLARLAADARRIIVASDTERAALSGWFHELRYRVRLQKTSREKFAVLAPHVFSPEGWGMWPLPDRWFFLYYPATPFLWLWRRLGRRSARS